MKQTSKAGKTTGSLFNYLMGNNSTIPVVGKGATMLYWTDRDAYQVMSVSDDLKTVVVKKCIAERIDNNGMSESQKYDYSKLSPIEETIVWKWNAWRLINKKIMFTTEYAKTIGDGWFNTPESKLCFPDGKGELVLIEGKTHVVTSYSKVNILWGTQREYYDYSF